MENTSTAAVIDYGKVKAIYNGKVYEYIDPAKLRAAREKCMFRQSDVARKVDVAVPTYAYWEAAPRANRAAMKAIPADKFSALCELLKVRAAELRPSA